MTPAFHKALARTSLHEKGYSNNPADPGGETMWGVTWRVARKWGYKGEMRFLPREMADEILFNEFWLSIRGDDLPFPLAYQLFDISVNSGPPRAIFLLQKTLGVTQDGLFGSKTLGAVNSGEISRVCRALLLERHEFQRKLPTWKTDFGGGWARRNLENAFYLADDISDLSPA